MGNDCGTCTSEPEDTDQDMARAPLIDRANIPFESTQMKSLYRMNLCPNPLKHHLDTSLNELSNNSRDEVMFSLELPLNPAIADVPCSKPVKLVIREEGIDFVEVDDFYFSSRKLETIKLFNPIGNEA